MAISSKNFKAAIFLTELSTQSQLARKAAEKLSNGTVGWLIGASYDDVKNSMSPLEIIAWCGVFLSAVSVVAKILFEGKRTRLAGRCSSIRNLLEIRDLHYLSGSSVRNSFEHIDERLDDILNRFSVGSLVPIHVHEKAPASKAVVMKRYCPRERKIYWGDAVVSVDAYLEDLTKVAVGIEKAFKILNQTKDKVM